ncbi:MAG TPA: hypothetical protein VKZ59_13455 [Acidobacteriota bacterium]|nr:hypothetical protein [Acidobacteriota bacterium]
MQPEATIACQSSREDVILILLALEGPLEVRGSRGERVGLQSGDVAKALVHPDEPVHLHNPSPSELSRLLQIWLRQKDVGTEGRVVSKAFETKQTRGTLLPVVSGQIHPEALVVDQDVAIYLSRLYPPEQLIFETLPERSTFLFLIDGHLRVGEERIHSGDGLAIWRESLVSITAQDRSQFVLIDLPPGSQGEGQSFNSVP